MPLYLDEEAVDSRLLTSPAARRYAAIRSPYNIVSNFQRAVSPPALWAKSATAVGNRKRGPAMLPFIAVYVALVCRCLAKGDQVCVISAQS